jgi:hypothetical protein
LRIEICHGAKISSGQQAVRSENDRELRSF